MKLAVLTNILTPYRIPLFAAMQKHVDELTVLLMAEREENRQWQLGGVPFKTRCLPGFHIKPPSYDVSVHVNYGVFRALREIGPDVILSGGFGPANVAALLYCKLNRKRLVNWAHLTLRDGANASFIKRAIRRWFAVRSDGCVAESTQAREAFIHYGADPDRVLVSLMPLDVNRIHQAVMEHRAAPDFAAGRARYEGPVLLSIGQIIARKGYAELFTIYERLLALGHKPTLLIVGDGPDRPRFMRMAEGKGWERVHFTGFVQPSELPLYLALSNVFLFHTLYDPFGLVLSEAMAAELPVVSSIHAASTHDLIEEGVTGFTMDPADPETAAATIHKVLALSPAQRAAIGRTAYRRVVEYDTEIAAEKTVRFLESLTP
jgi:glycosyltransferase involved in cell wall biosynthesis